MTYQEREATGLEVMAIMVLLAMICGGIGGFVSSARWIAYPCGLGFLVLALTVPYGEVYWVALIELGRVILNSILRRKP